MIPWNGPIAQGGEFSRAVGVLLFLLQLRRTRGRAHCPCRSPPQPRRRRRVVTLVDMEKQQQQQQQRFRHREGRQGEEEDRLPAAGDDFVLLPGEGQWGYRDADYDTDAGVAATRPRAVGAVVDMERDTGRGQGMAAGRGRAGDSSHGGVEGEPLVGADAAKTREILAGHEG